MPGSESEIRAAKDLAQQAEQLIGKLKVGGTDSIQSLALISIAKSLAVIAEQAAMREQR